MTRYILILVLALMACGDTRVPVETEFSGSRPIPSWQLEDLNPVFFV